MRWGERVGKWEDGPGRGAGAGHVAEGAPAVILQDVVYTGWEDDRTGTKNRRMATGSLHLFLICFCQIISWRSWWDA